MAGKTLKMTLKRTDLASELLRPRVKKIDEKISVTTVVVKESDVPTIGKAAGRYVAAVSDVAINGDTAAYPRLVRALSDVLKGYFRGTGTVLAVGLGNPSMSADSFGAETIRRVRAGGRLKTLIPSVSAVTGIESFDVIRAVTREIKPKAIIAADALCAASNNRLGTVFQVSDAGITPGSGVGNARREISRATLGVPVISVGVPTVIYSRTVAREAGGNEKAVNELVLTLGEIDRVAADCGLIAAEAINAAFGTGENSCAPHEKVL